MTGGETERKKKHNKNKCWNENEQKTVLEKTIKGEKTGQPTEFFSLLCFVFFIYKKGKHQKWCLNKEGEIVEGSAIFSKMADHVWMSAARMHADLIFDLWPLACPPGSPHSGRRLTILECFIASLYSISWQNVTHLIFPQRVNFQ